MSRVKLARLEGAEWVKRGPRGFLEYRDLGIAEATEGRFGGTVARVVELYREGGGTPRHTHDTGFHFIYILRGWLRTEFEGLGEVTMQAGDCIAYEGEVPQTHIEYSDDYEVLQITMPAEYRSDPVAAPAG